MEEIIIRDLSPNDSVEEVSMIITKGFKEMEKSSGIWEEFGDYEVSHHYVKYELDGYYQGN